MLQSNDSVIEELIAQRQIITNADFTPVEIQQKLISSDMLLGLFIFLNYLIL